MILLRNQPTLADIEALVKRVPHFPYSVKQLLDLAHEEHFPESVIRFYKTFPNDEVFEDAEDLVVQNSSSGRCRSSSRISSTCSVRAIRSSASSNTSSFGKVL